MSKVGALGKFFNLARDTKVAPVTAQRAAGALRGPETQQSADLLAQLPARAAETGGRKAPLEVALKANQVPPGKTSKSAVQAALARPLTVTSIDAQVPPLLRPDRPGRANRRSGVAASAPEATNDLLYSGSGAGLRLFQVLAAQEGVTLQRGSWRRAYDAWRRRTPELYDLLDGHKWFMRGDLSWDEDEALDLMRSAGAEKYLASGKYTYADYQRLKPPGGRGKYSEHAVMAPAPTGLKLMRGEPGDPRWLRVGDDDIPVDAGHYPLHVPLGGRERMAGHYRATQNPEGLFVEEVQPDPLQAVSRSGGSASATLRETPIFLGQAAVGQALLGKAPHLWLPDSKLVSSVRPSSKDYSPLYDHTLVRDFLQPLARVAGEPIQESDGWRGLRLSPELRREWLEKGVPYARGGRVQPTEAQKSAGNYKKGHLHLHGLRLSIENPAGSVRRGRGKDGKPWATKLQHDYGYIRGTQGRDKDHLDVFLGPDAADPDAPVHVVDQVDPQTGTFDEHKVMLGWQDADSALAAYNANYSPGWAGAGAVTPLTLQEFKFWAGEPGRRVKPAAEVKRYADGGAVFGHFPQLKRRREKNNDREGAKDLPVQAARGWAAGTLGLPGDIEALARSLFKAGAAPDSWRGTVIQDEPALPTSEFYKEWLPGATDSKTAGAGTELGSLFGGVGAGRAANAMLRGAKAAGAGVGAAVNAGMQPGGALARAFPAAQPMYAVKPKGGNWDPTKPWEMADDFIFGDRAAADPPAMAVWREKQLQRYVKNLMGTKDDPLLKLEEEGRLHLSPEDLLHRARMTSGNNDIEMQGRRVFPLRRGPSVSANQFHSEVTGRNYRTPWEELSDGMLVPNSKRDVMNNLGDIHEVPPDRRSSMAEMIANAGVRGGGPEELAQHAWLDKLPQNEKLWDLVTDGMDGMGGFEHVNDYLRAALRVGEVGDELRMPAAEAMHPFRPEQAAEMLRMLDRGLALTPAQLARTSVPDAVAKTAAWNKLLAESKSLESLNKGIKQVHKQYPETGYQWVELSPEGLADEGSAMRHCVGGYCSSVESGDTRILSLRGKDGQPKVTVEVAKGRPWNERSGVFYDNPELEASWRQYHDEYNLPGNPGHSAREDYRAPMGTLAVMRDRILGYPDWLKTKHPDVYSAHERVFQPGPAAIRQIKGPANRAPSKDVLPHVQDLVRNGLGDGLSGWGEVRDLVNADLLQAGKRYVTPSELGSAYEKVYGGPPPTQVSPQAYYQWLSRRDPNVLTDVDKSFLAEVRGPEEFAAGGAVHSGPKLTMSAFEQSVYDCDVPWAAEGSPLDAQMDKFQLDAENRARGYNDGGAVQRFDEGGEVGEVGEPGGSGPEPGEPTGAEVGGPAFGGPSGEVGLGADFADSGGSIGGGGLAAGAVSAAPGTSPTPSATPALPPETAWSPLGFLADLFVSLGIPFGGLVNAGVRGATGASLGTHLANALGTPGAATPGTSAPNEPGGGAADSPGGVPGGTTPATPATGALATGALATVGLPEYTPRAPYTPSVPPVTQLPFVAVPRSRRPTLRPSTQWDGQSGLSALSNQNLT